MAENETANPKTEAAQPRASSTAKTERKLTADETERGYIENKWSGLPHLSCIYCGWGRLLGDNSEGLDEMQVHLRAAHRKGSDPEQAEGVVIFDDQGRRIVP